MKRFIETLVLLTVGAVAMNAQLLYKISGNGMESPSYVIGTFRYANVGFINYIPGLKDALTNTKQVYGETVDDEMNRTDIKQKIKAAQTLSNGKTLETTLNAEQMKKLNAFLKKYMEVDFKSPTVKRQMNNQKPVTLAENLTQMLYLSNHMGEFDPTAKFDEYFQAQAKKNSEPVGSLETIESRLNRIYNAPAMEKQIATLMCVIDNEQATLNRIEAMSKAFNSQDMVAFEKAASEKIGGVASDENATLCAEWAKKMVETMAQTPTFFAISTEYLVGQKGILQSLRDTGYTVEGVK